MLSKLSNLKLITFGLLSCLLLVGCGSNDKTVEVQLGRLSKNNIPSLYTFANGTLYQLPDAEYKQWSDYKADEQLLIKSVKNHDADKLLTGSFKTKDAGQLQKDIKDLSVAQALEKIKTAGDSKYDSIMKKIIVTDHVGYGDSFKLQPEAAHCALVYTFQHKVMNSFKSFVTHFDVNNLKTKDDSTYTYKITGAYQVSGVASETLDPNREELRKAIITR